MRTAITSALLIAAGAAALLVASFAGAKDETKDWMTEADARYVCESGVRSLSSDPVAVKVGKYSIRHDVEYSFFYWSFSEFQMPGKTGEMVGKSVVCKINRKTRQVVYADFQ